MRNYTQNVVEKLNLTKAFRLYPFPGKYPTRVLIVERAREEWKLDEIRPLRSFKNYEVIYFGKPDLISLRWWGHHRRVNFMYYEFDKKNLVYAAAELGGQVIYRAAPSLSFYHAYAPMDAFNPWVWFLAPWKPLRVGDYNTYNHFPDKNANANLKEALANLLLANKILPRPKENVNL